MQQLTAGIFMERKIDLSGCKFGHTALVMVVIFHAVISHEVVEGRRSWKTDTDQASYLHQADKFGVKTMKTADGDIIDCVDIYKQPAFDHPDLKNHTIQMKPHIFPSGLEPEKVSSSSQHQRKLLQRIRKCPEGTIPLLRTRTSETVARKGRRMANVNAENGTGSANMPYSGHEYAVASVINGEFYGAKADINLWNPYVEGPEEFSLAQIWVMSGAYETKDINTVEAGWMVNPALYGDRKTRLFIYWTNSTYQGPGCYNHRCSGFVQTSTEIALGAAITNPSTYGGEQYEITIVIFKDKSSGNWWLMIQDIQVGYWPEILFKGLAHSASRIDWGGEIVNDGSVGHHTGTQMGSGHFPSEGFRKASYFRNLFIVDSFNNYMAPPAIGKTAGTSKCFDIEIKVDTASDWGNYFFYGGPGKSPNCP
ncbi:protein neprosin-like [Aristolochia californica]|uniref:protein neprosin-like n=1 Tax=Aristolochia californica TaxID=171875 RepID=UPI0035E26C88